MLDYLLLEVSVHDYTSFRSAGNKRGEQFTKMGNKYRSPIVTYRENKELVTVFAALYTEFFTKDFAISLLQIRVELPK